MRFIKGKDGRDRLPVVYIAGPLTSSGLTSTNIRRAVDAAIELREHGCTPFIPHLFWFSEFMTWKNDEQFWLGWDYDLIGLCDALVRLPGASSGADNEVKVAERFRIPVFHGLDECKQWLNSGSP